MSGIAGWVTLGGAASDEAQLAPMLEALAQRGIEGLCAYVDRRAARQVVLGADLFDEAARIALVLDGAIVNARELRAQLAKRGHRFERASDAEVLLRAYQHWDKEVVRQLRGQFAFAIWDARKDRLMLARDRFGEKPLYLHERGGTLHFASEARALRAILSLEVDPGALRDCLVHRYVPGPGTLFRGVRKLGPATHALWQFGRLHEVRYWIAPDREPRSGGGAPHAVEGFAAALEESVRLRPAGGVFLSGGLDSATLVALAGRQGGAQLHTFAFAMQGDRKSELARAAEVAKHCGTVHHEVVAAPDDLACSLPQVVAWRDAPVARPSDLAVHRLAAAAHGAGVKRVLTGEGCDEVLGGYRWYAAACFAGGMFDVPRGFPAPMPGIEKLLLIKTEPRKADQRMPPLDADPQASRLRRALYAGQTGPLPDHLLERTDRMTMAASVESHNPFLDHRVAESVSALPDAMRVRGMATKWILRQAARSLIPAGMRRRAQGGFRLRAKDLLGRELLLEHLGGTGSLTRHYYDTVALDRMLEEHLKGRKNHETPLWTLLNIEIWHRTCARG